jgi:hypothetical protein
VRASWSPRPRQQALARRRRRELVMTGPAVGVEVTDAPSMRADWRQADAGDDPTELLASKLRDGHLDRTMGSGAWIDLAIPTGELATARDGTAVHLRLLRRDEQELVAGFFAGLSNESRRRRFPQPMPRLPEAMLRRLVEVDGECVGIASYVALADDRTRPRSRSPSPTATRAAASGGCWLRPCGRPPSAPAWPRSCTCRPDQPAGAAAAGVAWRPARSLRRPGPGPPAPAWPAAAGRIQWLGSGTEPTALANRLANSRADRSASSPLPGPCRPR